MTKYLEQTQTPSERMALPSKTSQHLNNSMWLMVVLCTNIWRHIYKSCPAVVKRISYCHTFTVNEQLIYQSSANLWSRIKAYWCDIINILNITRAAK